MRIVRRIDVRTPEDKAQCNAGRASAIQCSWGRGKDGLTEQTVYAHANIDAPWMGALGTFYPEPKGREATYSDGRSGEVMCSVTNTAKSVSFIISDDEHERLFPTYSDAVRAVSQERPWWHIDQFGIGHIIGSAQDHGAWL